MSFQDIIHSTVTIGPSPEPSAGFGLRMILAQHDNFTNATRLYAGTVEDQLKSILVDGFTKNDAVYRAIKKTGGLDKSSNRVVIAKRTPGTKKISSLTITAADLFKYQIKTKSDSNGIPVLLSEFTSSLGATVQEIRDGLLANIDKSQPFLVEADADDIKVTAHFYHDFQLAVSGNLVSSVATAFVQSPQAIGEALDFARDERPDAYRYEILTLIDSEIEDVASWVSTKDVMPFLVNSSAKNLAVDATSAAAKMKSGQHKVNLFVSDRYWEFPNVGIDSNRATFSLDKENPTYNNVALSGYSALKNDGKELTAAEKENLNSNNAYYLHRTGSAARTCPLGKLSNDSSTSNRWTDHRISRDYIDVRIREALATLIGNEAQSGAGLEFDEVGRAKIVKSLTDVWSIARGPKKHVSGDISIELSLEELTVSGVLTRVIAVEWEGKLRNKISIIKSDGKLLLAV